MTGYIYIIQLREHKNTNLFKIGSTQETYGRKINMRFKAYPKDSSIKIILMVADYKSAEQKVKGKFATLFKQRIDIGSEYFEGSLKQMISEYMTLVSDAEIKENKIDVDPMIQSATHDFVRICCVLRNAFNKLNAGCNIYEIHGWHLINSNTPRPGTLHLDKIMAELKKNYGRPTRATIVTCQNYSNYVMLYNNIAESSTDIIYYETQRKCLVNPSGFPIIIFNKPLVHIENVVAESTIKKCSDYDKNKKYYFR